MVHKEKQLIEQLKSKFCYKEGTLYWNCGRKFGKQAGYMNKDGYIEINVNFGYKNNKKFLAHRVIFAIHFNYFPDLIDHIDRNPKNNLIENLRDANKTINAINTDVCKKNTSGIKGVRYNKNTDSYEVYINIKIDGSKKKLHLGLFKDIEEAKNIRLKAEKTYWYDI